jgi:phosphoglycolate phosphatase
MRQRRSPALPSRRPPAALVFDLDGTLVDSARDLATAVNRARGDYDLPALAVPAVVAMVGDGARALIQRALPAGWSEVAIDAALARLLDHYAQICTATTVAYPGIVAALEQLLPRIPLAVLTNKPESMTRRILEHLDLRRFFAVVVGGDSRPTRKPDPEPLRWIATTLGVSVGDTMLIGDSAVDAHTAGAAGARFALVGWGYGVAQAAALQPELRIASPADLCGSDILRRPERTP